MATFDDNETVVFTRRLRRRAVLYAPCCMAEMNHPSLVCRSLLWTAVLAAGLAQAGERATPGQTAWHKGKDFWRQLELPIGVDWSEIPLRQAVADLARTQNVCIWLDRRIDPGLEPHFVSPPVPLNAMLAKLAASLGVGVGYMDSVVYLGPKPAASRLATLAALRMEEAAKLPARRRAAVLDRQVWQWDDLATPRELIDQLAQQAQFTVSGIEQVPHDLWPAYELPPLTVVERLSLVLAGFDLTFDFARDGAEIRLIPMPATAVLVRSYAHRGDLDRVALDLQRAFPGVEARRAGGRLAVSGSFEDQMLVQRWLRGEKATVEGETRHTLTVKNQPLGAVLEALARRLGYTLDVDPRVAPGLEQRVSFRVENATTEELFQSALRDTGIRCQIEGQSLKLLPAE